MNRIDALGDARRERFNKLTGSVLDRTADGTLQALVRQATEELGLPIGLVSLVLKHTQFFRAHHGLPPDLVAAQATDRDASFCQFVVRDEAFFEVNHAAFDARVPQELVAQYGVQAYLGEPIRIGGAVVGSFCVIDTSPRSFSEQDRQALRRIAARVSERLEQLAGQERATNRELVAHAVGPGFGEAMNILAGMDMGIREAAVVAADASALPNLIRELPSEWTAQWPAFASLTRAAGAVDEFRELVDILGECARRLVPTLKALESLFVGSHSTARVNEVVETASTLAFHYVKLVGGLTWDHIPSGLEIAVPRMVATAALSSALRLLSSAIGGGEPGIRGTVVEVEREVILKLFANSGPVPDVAGCAAKVQQLLDGDSRVSILAEDGCLSLRLPLTTHSPP